LSDLKAVILVGGPGTRLQPLTYDTPKSMVPVLNRPFMEHIFAGLGQFGIKETVLALNYLPGVIRDYFGDGSLTGPRLTYCVEDTPLGTAGAVKNVAKHLDGTFVVLNGDVFTDLDISAMLSFHRQRQAVATIALHHVENPGAFGVVETGEDGKVKRFIEKPPPGEAPCNWINAGTYILEPEALQYIPEGRHYMFENGLYPGLLDMGKPVYAYQHCGYWIDMGTPQKYFALNRDLLLGATSSPLTVSNREGITCGNGVAIAPSSELAAPAVIGDNATISGGVRIKGPAAIGKGCRVEEDVIIEDSVIWDNVSIGAGARLRRCIISSGASIEPGSRIADSVITLSETAPLSL
jgi:mannose-1-phosphate guanylyltransferase